MPINESGDDGCYVMIFMDPRRKSSSNTCPTSLLSLVGLLQKAVEFWKWEDMGQPFLTRLRFKTKF